MQIVFELIQKENGTCSCRNQKMLTSLEDLAPTYTREVHSSMISRISTHPPHLINLLPYNFLPLPLKTNKTFFLSSFFLLLLPSSRSWRPFSTMKRSQPFSKKIWVFFTRPMINTIHWKFHWKDFPIVPSWLSGWMTEKPERHGVQRRWSLLSIFHSKSVSYIELWTTSNSEEDISAQASTVDTEGWLYYSTIWR
jgi:hypothetical protein